MFLLFSLILQIKKNQLWAKQLSKSTFHQKSKRGKSTLQWRCQNKCLRICRMIWGSYHYLCCVNILLLGVHLSGVNVLHWHTEKKTGDIFIYLSPLVQPKQDERHDNKPVSNVWRPLLRSRSLILSVSQLIWLVHKSCWHQHGWKLAYSCTNTHKDWGCLLEWEQQHTAQWSSARWITHLSFIIPWLSLTFKKPLTPLRFTLVYISCVSTLPTYTRACMRSCMLQCVWVCLNDLSDNT